MVQPASADDIARLASAISGLDRKVSFYSKETTDHLRRIHQDIEAALTAIGDEQVSSESDYVHKITILIEEIRQEMRDMHQQLRRELNELDVQQHQLKESLEKRTYPNQRKV